MITQNIDGVFFEMKEAYDFSFLAKYGRVFCVFSKNDSGNISFGTDDGENRYFVKIAGTKTVESRISPEDAIRTLKKAIPLYKELAHPNLIEFVEHFEYCSVYVAVFKWACGDCLFDHWNFNIYDNNPNIAPPRVKFKGLSREKRLNAFDVMFDFLVFIESKGYTAIDFYDGSIMYDFERDVVTICDIDFFNRPLVNDIGVNFWGTKRFKAPEEYSFGANIDTITNVFTLGALIMHYFGSFTDAEIGRMYEKSMFVPCRYETWELSERLYKIALKAVCQERVNRYDSMKHFSDEWRAGLQL